MTVWSIWTQRNQLRLQLPSVTIDKIAQASRNRLEEYKATMPTQKSQQRHPRIPWLPAPPDVFKINYDGAVFKEENKSGIRVIIWNNQELVIASLIQQLSQACKAVEVEAMAAL